jgi:uncharacterized SAM-binding protein YcdF (DUF218 family)
MVKRGRKHNRNISYRQERGITLHMIWMIVGILCALYCLALAITGGTGTWFFLIWGILGVAFTLWGIFRGRIWHAMPHWLHITAGTLFLLMLAVFLFTEGCIISGFSKNTDKELDYIVVLGAQLKTTGPSRVLQYRLDTAYEYLTAHPDTKVIVSGGQGSNEPASEAQGMYDYLVKRGIEPGRIVLEDKSVNTEQNIRFSKEFLQADADKVGIVSNNFHVFRAVKLAKAAGYRNVVGIAAPATAFYLPNNMLREFFGVVKDFLMGHF